MLTLCHTLLKMVFITRRIEFAGQYVLKSVLFLFTKSVIPWNLYALLWTALYFTRGVEILQVYQSPRWEIEEVADTASTEEEEEEDEENGAERKVRRLRKRILRSLQLLTFPCGGKAATIRRFSPSISSSHFPPDSLPNLALPASLVHAHQVFRFRLIVIQNTRIKVSPRLFARWITRNKSHYHNMLIFTIIQIEMYTQRGTEFQKNDKHTRSR